MTKINSIRFEIAAYDAVVFLGAPVLRCPSVRLPLEQGI